MSTKNNKNKGGLVYSTESDATLSDFFGDLGGTSHHQNEEASYVDQKVRVWLDRKSRKGKEVTLVKGLLVSIDELKRISKELKGKCGTGGSVVDGDILLQGDHRDQVLEYLRKLGVVDIKKAGG